jgi:regulatory LuxR family protein
MADVDPELAGCTLTLRQQRILVLFSQGLTNREIAHMLRLSARTVRGEERQIVNQLFRESSRADIEATSSQGARLVSAAPPEEASVKFWSSPRLTAKEIQIAKQVIREGRRADIDVRSGPGADLVSAAPPEAAWVKFWSSPRLTAAAVVTLMLVVLLRFLHH